MGIAALVLVPLLFLYDVTGGYRAGFVFSLACVLVAAAPFWTSRILWRTGLEIRAFAREITGKWGLKTRSSGK